MPLLSVHNLTSNDIPLQDPSGLTQLSVKVPASGNVTDLSITPEQLDYIYPVLKAEAAANRLSFVVTDDPSVAAGTPTVMRADVVLASAAVKTLHATPVQVIAAPGAGKFIEIISMHAYLKFGTAAYDGVAATDFLELRHTDGSGALLTQTVDPTGFGNAAADAHVLILPASGIVPLDNGKVVAFIAGTEWFAAAGDSALHLEILYRIRKTAI